MPRGGFPRGRRNPFFGVPVLGEVRLLTTVQGCLLVSALLSFSRRVFEGDCSRGVSRYPSAFDFFFFYGGCSGVSELRALPSFYHTSLALLRKPTGAEAVSDVAQHQHQKHQAPTRGRLGERDIPSSPLPPSFLGSVAQSSSGHTATAERTISRGIFTGLAPSGNSIGRFSLFPCGKYLGFLSSLPVFSLLGKEGMMGGEGSISLAER